MINYIINFLNIFIPDSRFFKFKNTLWGLAGYNIDRSARLISSVKIKGNFNLSVGKDTFIGHDTMILGGKSTIVIGNYCDISSRVTLITGTHEIDVNGKRIAGAGKSLDIAIGDGVWIGVGAIILGGTIIGEKAIIAAGSVVNRNIEPYSVVGGVPAKLIKKYNRGLSKWETPEEVN